MLPATQLIFLSHLTKYLGQIGSSYTTTDQTQLTRYIHAAFIGYDCFAGAIHLYQGDRL